MELHSLYSFDIFLQGTFLSICLAVGLYLVFNDNLEKLRTSESVGKLSKNIHELTKQIVAIATLKKMFDSGNQTFKYLIIIPLTIVLSFILGILGYGIADEWIDSKTEAHVFLKPLWISDLSLTNDYFERIDLQDAKIGVFRNYKKRIRYQSFLQVYDPKGHKPTARTIEQLYFHAKHELIKDEKFYDYIRKSQTLVEYSRVFALGFFILFICGLVNLFIMVVRVIFTPKEELYEKYKNALPENGKKFKTKYLDLPDMVIIIFNLISALAIWVLVGPHLQNMLRYHWSVYILVVLLLFFGCFTFFLNLSGKFRTLRFSFFIYSIFYVVSFLGYFGAAKMWVSGEKIVSRKVFGVYKSMYISPDMEEIKYAEEKLNLDLFTKNLE